MGLKNLCGDCIAKGHWKQDDRPQKDSVVHVGERLCECVCHHQKRNEEMKAKLKFRKDIEDWMQDDALILAIEEPDEITEVVLIKNTDDTYTVLRAFTIGKNVAVSQDECNKNADELLVKFFRNQK